MIKIVSFPIAVISGEYEFAEEFNKRLAEMKTLEAAGVQELGEALDNGFYIADSTDVKINRMVYLRYTLHQFDKAMIPPYES